MDCVPYQGTQGLTPEQFELLRTRFEDLADRLSDEQMLALADTYHEALRQRRAIRARHPLVNRPADGEGPQEHQRR